MALGFVGKESSLNLNHVVSFLLGAALPSILLFVLASDRVGEQLSTISSWGNGTLLPTGPAQEAANLTSNGTAPTQDQEARFPGLAAMLPKVAMEDSTVIVTSVNEAWARPNSLLDLFRESFEIGEDIAHLLNHVLVVAADAGALDRCKAVHRYCYLLEVKSMNVSSANRFGTKGFIELVWTKLELQQRVLELGYNFLYTDVDVMWFRNPFRHINVFADVTMSCDLFTGDIDSLDNWPNTGFYHVKSTNRTVELLRQWRAARARFPPEMDQGIFERVKRELASAAKVSIQFVDTARFSTFCQYHNEMDRVCTMHANCCIGLENKVHDLRNVVADWKNYTSLTAQEKKSGKIGWTYPAQCKASMKRL